MAPATPIGSRTRGAKSPCSSSSFINASAVPSPTVCSIIRQTPRGHRRRHSKPPIEKPTDRFSRCWTFSLRKCLNSETKILRLVHQEPMADRRSLGGGVSRAVSLEEVSIERRHERGPWHSCYHARFQWCPP